MRMQKIYRGIVQGGGKGGDGDGGEKVSQRERDTVNVRKQFFPCGGGASQ